MRLAIIFGILAEFLVLTPVEAKPWYRDWKAWALGAATIGSSLLATHEIHACRQRVGIEQCNGGYGEFRAREGIRFVTSGGMFALSLWGRHEGYTEKGLWMYPALGFTAWNTGVAIHDGIRSCPSGATQHPCFQ